VVTAGYSGYSRLQWLQQVTVVTAGYSGYSRLQQVTVVTAGYSGYSRLQQVTVFYVIFKHFIYKMLKIYLIIIQIVLL
jgi:hypothetical protein